MESIQNLSGDPANRNKLTIQLCFCLDPVTISFLIDIHSTTVTPCPTLDPGFNFHYGKGSLGSLEEANYGSLSCCGYSILRTDAVAKFNGDSPIGILFPTQWKECTPSCQLQSDFASLSYGASR